MAASGSKGVAFDNFLFLSALLLAGGLTSYNNKICILKRIRTISPINFFSSCQRSRSAVVPSCPRFSGSSFQVEDATKPGLGLLHPIIANKPSFQRAATKTVLRLITQQECGQCVTMLILLALPSYTDVSLFNDMF